MADGVSRLGSLSTRADPDASSSPRELTTFTVSTVPVLERERLVIAPRPVQVNGHTILTAIWKHPVEGQAPLRGVNLRGDDQADRAVHGGPDKAVDAYAIEDTEWWETELERQLGPGAFGEPTVRGLPVSEAVIGEQWTVGTALLEVSQPRLPCFKLGLRMDDPRFLKRFARAGRPGAYLRVLREGNIAAGDAIKVEERPAHGVTSAFVSRALLGERQLLAGALAARELPRTYAPGFRSAPRTSARDENRDPPLLWKLCRAAWAQRQCLRGQRRTRLHRRRREGRPGTAAT